MNRIMRSKTFQPLVAAAFSAALLLLPAGAASANDKMEAEQLVEKAQLVLRNFQCDETMGAFRALMPKAHGVLIVPNLLKGAFVVGASGGSGVFLARSEHGDSWSEPAFYTLGSGSIGMQAGGSASEVILLAMTDRGVKSFLGHSLKLGADAGIAAGPVGLGASAATLNLSADIVSFSRSKGAYGGISLDGAVVAVREDLNGAHYGRPVSTLDVLVERTATNPRGASLARFVERSASGELSMKWCPVPPLGEGWAETSGLASASR